MKIFENLAFEQDRDTSMANGRLGELAKRPWPDVRLRKHRGFGLQSPRLFSAAAITAAWLGSPDRVRGVPVLRA